MVVFPGPKRYYGIHEQKLVVARGSGDSKTRSELALLKELDGLVAVSKAVQEYAKLDCDVDLCFVLQEQNTSDWPRYQKGIAEHKV